MNQSGVTVSEASGSSYQSVDIPSEKRMPSDNKMDCLDTIIFQPEDDDDENWTVVQKKSKGSKSTWASDLSKIQSTYRKVRAKESQGRDDGLMDVENSSFADRKYLLKEENITPPLMSDGCHSEFPTSLPKHAPPKFDPKPSDAAQKHPISAEVPLKSAVVTVTEVPKINDTVIKSSQSITSTTKTTTTTETIITEKISISSDNAVLQTPDDRTPSVGHLFASNLDKLTEQHNLEPASSALVNAGEGSFSFPFFDPAIIDMSFLHPFGHNIPAAASATPSSFLSQLYTPGSLHDSGSRLKDNMSHNAKQEKSKTTRTLSSFDILMSRLTEKFPSKTR